jgi:hypothetical protein
MIHNLWQNLDLHEIHNLIILQESMSQILIELFLKKEYESIRYQAGRNIVLDSGVILINSSTPEGELSFLNNTIAIYKDTIEEGQNFTTIAWMWK